MPEWTHFSIDEAMPGNSWGTGGIGLADLSGDGHLDVAVSRRDTKTVYWYQRQDDATWIRRVLGTAPELSYALGVAVLDINGNGLLDIALSYVWFENPGNLAQCPDTPWQAHPYGGGGHDVVAVDINGNGRLDIATFNGHRLAWFDTSKELEMYVIDDGLDGHGGIGPKGYGDLNGNGHTDLVLPGVWYENPGGGLGEWAQHAFPHKAVPHASYGTSMRAWIVDLNGSGHNDIVYSDCDTGWGHVYWVENLGNGESWQLHALPDPPGDMRTGSFHSLGVADFNGNGLLDIFGGEQEDADTYMEADGLLAMKPRGLRERGVIWFNKGDGVPTFEPEVIHAGRPGWHDVALGDVDGDGDVDLVSKVWNADGPNYHVDYWRNDISS